MTSFYPRASFNAFPNATRAPARPSNAPSYREPPSVAAQQFYPADPFPPQLTSPVLQPYDPRASFDFKASSGGPYALDGGYGQPPQPQQQQQQGGQQKLNGYAAPYVNGGMHSQTPYGPHVPMGVVNVNGGGLPPSGMMPSMGGGMQEDISTIFVVGFPEDMQEREFQNMFTFSPGFEAATLKIPNKEYTAYGGVLLPSSNANNSNATNAVSPNGGGANNNKGGYYGANDPYNLVTVNQGGVVVDAGRDGMASWPAAPPPTSDESASSSHYNSSSSANNNPNANPNNNGNGNPNAGMTMAMGMGIGAGNMANQPPRKQIIGFAKFRTREEALGARDVLQGRRVDIDKGAVLKAEMAKKNLHTKRGVGPVGGAGAGAGVGGSGIG
ncbi:hypothetical protein C8F04DRAFT_941485, partial [Mycena alexandri]